MINSIRHSLCPDELSPSIKVGVALAMTAGLVLAVTGGSIALGSHQLLPQGINSAFNFTSIEAWNFAISYTLVAVGLLGLVGAAAFLSGTWKNQAEKEQGARDNSTHSSFLQQLKALPATLKVTPIWQKARQSVYLRSGLQQVAYDYRVEGPLLDLLMLTEPAGRSETQSFQEVGMLRIIDVLHSSPKNYTFVQLQAMTEKGVKTLEVYLKKEKKGPWHFSFRNWKKPDLSSLFKGKYTCYGTETVSTFAEVLDSFCWQFDLPTIRIQSKDGQWHPYQPVLKTV